MLSVWIFLRVRVARTQHIDTLARKRRRAQARRRNNICSKTGLITSVLHSNDVSDRFQLTFTSKINMDERKDLLLVKLHCLPSAGDSLDNFHMSQAMFIFVCNELRLTIKRTDTEMRKAVPVEQRVALTLVSSYECRLLHHRPSIWGVKIYRVYDNDNQGSVCCYCESFTAQVHPIQVVKSLRFFRDFEMN